MVVASLKLLVIGVENIEWHLLQIKRIYTSGFGKIFGDLKDMYLVQKKTTLKRKLKKRKRECLK